MAVVNLKSVLILLSVAAGTIAQQSAWGQCGGIGWTGATTCVAGYTCVFNGDYYSQCIPGTNTNTVPTPTTSSPTSSTLPVSSSGSSPLGPLQSGYYWIRAVESPNFHKYLQSSPLNSPGRAVLADYTTAAQFQIDSTGQLVQRVNATSFLYANVQPNSTTGAVKLSMTFNTTKGTYGSFQWSGDALQWSVAGLTRPNLSAWLVCANQSLWINLGNYDYMTPTGCADETIHFYNAATPTPRV